MADNLQNVNQTAVLGVNKAGVNLQWFTITFPGAVNGVLSATTAGVKSPVVVALEAVQSVASIEYLGTLQNSNTELSIGVAALGADFGTDTYDGTNSETFAAHLEDLVQALGTLQGINNGSTTVGAGIASDL
mgnify:FL=1|jgi:hypothetical protein|tara:strand:- start:335 stop:730 length:396 start_codon:yes stop_codon:yes gene_type:complete